MLAVIALSNLGRFFRIRFANRGVGVFRWIYRFFDRRRGRLGWGTKLDSGGRRHIQFDAIRMPEVQEWKPDTVGMIFRSEATAAEERGCPL